MELDIEQFIRVRNRNIRIEGPTVRSFLFIDDDGKKQQRCL